MKNEVYRGKNIDFPIALIVTANTLSGANKLPLAGEPTMVGDLAGVTAVSPGVPAFDYAGQPVNTYAAVMQDAMDIQLVGTFQLPVKATNAVTPGERLYWDPATGLLSDDNTKTYYGHAIDPINAATTATIRVRLKHG